MLTDTELTDALRLTFAEATNTLDPPAELGADVHRRYRAARRRRAALRVTVPAAVAAAVGTWVALGPAPGTSSPAAGGPGTSPNRASAPSQTPAGYLLSLPAGLDVPCLPMTRRPHVPYELWPSQLVLRDTGQDCIIGLVSFIGGFPDNSVPIHRPGLTGLNEMAPPGGPVQQIFKPISPDRLTPETAGSCYDLTISSEVSDQMLTTYFLPALDNIIPGH